MIDGSFEVVSRHTLPFLHFTFVLIESSIDISTALLLVLALQLFFLLDPAALLFLGFLVGLEML